MYVLLCASKGVIKYDFMKDITLYLNPQQMKKIVQQQTYPFKHLINFPQEFERVYTWSSFVEAYQTMKVYPRTQKIIEIGCGQAGVAAIQNISFGCEVWLIDGNNPGDRTFGYEHAGSMEHYSTWHDLPETMERWGCDMSRIHFVDIPSAESYNFPVADLIQSFRSCGYHYPLSTYDFLFKKQDDDTKYLFTVTNKQLKKEPGYLKDFEIESKQPQIGATKINYYYMRSKK